MKRLLVTSDDFGMCHAVNVGIARAMTEGIVKSTNLLAPCPWFSEAVELCKTHSLSSGVHLCITNEWDRLKWGPLTEARSLRTPEGYFPSDHAVHADRATDEDILVELEAQIARVVSCGIEPTHFDTHMLPSRGRSPHGDRMRAIVQELSAKYGLPYTYERLATNDGGDGPLRHFTDELEMSSHPDDVVRRRLESWTEPGTYHLIGHAGVASDELRSVCSDGNPWAEEYRARDLAFFTDPSMRAWLTELGFDLVTARDVFG